MDLIQTVVNAVVVAAVGLVLAWMVHGLRAELKTDIARLEDGQADLRSELTSGIAGLRGELKADIARVEDGQARLRAEMLEELRALRSDLTQVALAVGARPRAGNE